MTRDILMFSALLVTVAAVIAAPVSASVKPNPLFSTNAVLQRNIPVPVWGDACDGEKVTVKFNGQKASTTAKGGRWMVKLAPMPAGGPYTMTISGDNSIEIANVMVGEVWICSGQSNMQMQLFLTDNAESAVQTADDPMMRLFTVPVSTAPKPQRDFASKASVFHDYDMYMLMHGKTKEIVSEWEIASPESAKEFSAVGYYFARELRKHLNVPVGIINASLGATTTESWTNPEAFADKSLRLVDWPEPNKPGQLYNGMISPLVPYAIRGAIWYQGESNTGTSYDYRKTFPAMINSWRKVWGQGDFPFLFTQIAPWQKIDPEPAESAWAELREAQLLSSKSVPNTAMAVITDSGDQIEIHPKKKEPVGVRLALAARALAYGEKVVYSGPTYRSMTIKGDRIVLEFDNIGSGLMAKGGDLTGFAIAGDDRKFVWAHASIQGGRVVVSSPQVDHPVAVRYGWANYPVVNLYNKESLPASPFRTDAFQLITEPRDR
ncbi:MAG: sialate O-acetylesterase [Armatimonadota bacterium]